MIYPEDLKENWETFPDEQLKEKIGFDGIIKAMNNFDDTVNDDDWIWYPFRAVYNQPPIKGRVPEPTGELADKIDKWEGKILGNI